MQWTARRMFKLGTKKTKQSPTSNAPAPASKVNARYMAAATIHDEPTPTKSGKSNLLKGHLSSKLKRISSTATKAIKRASQKVSRILSTSKSEGFPSRVRPHRKLTPYPGPAVCDSSESSQQDIHRSAYQEAENDSCRDTESSYSLGSSSDYPSFNLMACGPLTAHDPGYIPSPYEHTGTSMEVCEWASSPAISTDIYAIRKAAAEGDQTDDSIRRASCLNRADQHLYHVPGRLNIRLPNGATGQMRLSPEYPRGAKGLKRPDDSDFPSWHRDTDGYMVPTPRLLQGVFLPEPSRLREVETVQSAKHEEEFRSLGQNVTLHSFRRKRSLVYHQCRSSTGLVRPTLQAASVAEEEDTFTESPEDASLFSTFDGSYDVCDTDSQVASNERTTQNIGFRRLPLTHARNPITRSTGHLNLRSVSRGIIIEEEGEEEEGFSALERSIRKESKEDTPDEETGEVQLYESGFDEADSEPTAGADSEFAIPEMHEGSGPSSPEFDSDSYDWESAIIEQAQLCSIQQVKARLISQPRPDLALPNPHK